MTEFRADLGESPPHPRESEIVRNIIESNLKMMPQTPSGPGRAQHPKGHGVVQATVTMAQNLPADLARGIFAAGRTCEALIRFSNGGKSDDSEEDAHGMAIKLMGVDGAKLGGSLDGGTTADIILIDNETFFLGDLEEYDAFNDLLAEIVDARRNGNGKLSALLNGLYLKFIRRHTKGDLLTPALEFSDQQPVSPLRSNYFSAVPYLLGDRAVKYMARPVPPPGEAELTGGVDDKDGLGAALFDGLSSGPAAFELLVDVQDTPARHPVEDPTVSWSENGARREVVGRIDIPAMDAEGAALARARVDDIAFNPWNTLAENRPLGAINRVRRLVYQELSAARG